MPHTRESTIEYRNLYRHLVSLQVERSVSEDCFGIMRKNRGERTLTMERVAEPAPSFAWTTSSPPNWMRWVRALMSSSENLAPSTCCQVAIQTANVVDSKVTSNPEPTDFSFQLGEGTTAVKGLSDYCKVFLCSEPACRQGCGSFAIRHYEPWLIKVRKLNRRRRLHHNNLHVLRA